MNWTKGQKQAIESQSGDITVAASAGTGKTTVLSHRAVRILGLPELCPDVSDILVLTFTEAAAGEMKLRIAQYLKDKANKNIYLRRHLLMLDGADISTVHSFCKRIISRHFHRLGLNPAFRVMDEDESKLIKAEILQQIIEEAWDDFPQGMTHLLDGRAVSNPSHNFLNCVIDVSNFLDTVISRPNWFDRALVYNDAAISAASDAVKNQKQFILDNLKTFKEQFKWSLSLDEKIANGHWKEQIEKQCIPVIACAVELLEKDDLKNFIKHLNSFEKFRWNRRPKEFSDELKKLVLSAADKAKEGFKNLNAFAVLNPDYTALVAGACSVQTKVLIELVKKFDLAYQTRKQQLNCVDFADLEKYMLKLLSENGDVAPAKPSDIALQLRKSYKYIFVDEYQDINPVQQRIIDLLSGSAKVFVVGDVKQSIYAWRGADCGLFVQRLGKTGIDESKSRVDLNENFRSRPGVLNFVNEIFSRIMLESIAAVDYDENAALKPFNASSDKSAKPDVELLIVDDDPAEENDDDEEQQTDGISADAVNRRALTVAERIKELVEVEKFEVYDKDISAFRPCRWNDFVILTRDFKHRANNYVQILRCANIPVVSDSSAGYFAATEINDMLSLLQVLDNPRQDIPLASVLRSPIFSLSDTQLAQIKSHKNSESDFYSLLESVAEKSDVQDLQKTVSDILRRLDDWRTLARRGSLADLIWQIYSQTGLLSFVSALPGGSQRHANLLKLHQRAIQFENFASSFNVISLSRFVNFLQKLLESGGDWAPAEPDSSASDAVRVMSVHKSKGLEFPIVILAETNREFRLGSHIGDCITDNQATIGLRIIDENSGTKLPSLTWQVIKEKQIRQSLAEEMRILYVAMTRAKDKLIVSGAAESKRCVSLLSSAALCDLGKLPRFLIESAKSELDWILLSLAEYEKLQTHFKLPIQVDSRNDNIFDLIIYQPDEILKISSRFLKKLPVGRYETIKTPLPDKTLLENITKNLNWQYPLKDCASIKTKQSVTSIVHQEEFAEADRSFSFDSFEKLTGRGDSLVIGSATHLVIKNIDLTDTVDKDKICQAVNRLLKNGYTTKQAAEKIDISAILKFFSSDLGRLVTDSKNIVLREWPFTYAVSAAELYPDLKNCTEEKIIIQGIVDMLIKTPSGLVVIDFKTDRIDSSQLKQRSEHYAPQLKWYCKAAAEILNIKNVTGWLYFLTPAIAVKI
ncbi:MAG: helicase-exonuclease AddAB subunit AddA [Planctomycetes bacterium HGW-Planctomycetes-1]|nr:MAG: helicase-exonuclease AddAB subunit AddA [Planctomycetes bacterium HGW-Planctomycetes-1]